MAANTCLAPCARPWANPPTGTDFSQSMAGGGGEGTTLLSFWRRTTEKKPRKVSEAGASTLLQVVCPSSAHAVVAAEGFRETIHPKPGSRGGLRWGRRGASPWAPCTARSCLLGRDPSHAPVDGAERRLWRAYGQGQHSHRWVQVLPTGQLSLPCGQAGPAGPLRPPNHRCAYRGVRDISKCRLRDRRCETTRHPNMHAGAHTCTRRHTQVSTSWGKAAHHSDSLCLPLLRLPSCHPFLPRAGGRAGGEGQVPARSAGPFVRQVSDGYHLAMGGSKQSQSSYLRSQEFS